MISEVRLGALEQHFSRKSHDITFYDIPWYWSDMEIYSQLNENVGYIEYMRIKRCHKYRTVRATLRFSNAYEQIYKNGGVNVSITKGERNYFFRMFDSRLTYNQVKEKYFWQASKKLEDSALVSDYTVIKEYVKEYKAFFGKNR
ncbi:uncharacterized protein OCT59_005954 [Rhizophagus irregularis]|uniref:Uncharacterized protein n=1 Tax=Rhizophagus irregularis (strain DAOM 181602 / DAOM 197198 / MUCL 43194) TaxID=747089 RepID=A0A2H5T706_RHIID|nr:hypothetical protein GLOIN_2v1871647 [Rhizophagus irregularis DAOM 181602=DAOM 197198]POG76996.1 hypothetical protein GLOIN_2v1871647 [Rhizophagus irregularis DAOM 181602=DAOM 197198]UZO14497.1 hypothetical protein OCT59_005954 [Rhizophagus irregularis]GBC38205.1 hypothetical protein GLOIN_2v1871647 [Rhizophagus irregularis DAOM 181602=DAOM 197198]|eukprot:XP_025183862.1 hypothetical protein GLOIN_2v1871647 [Rhizophagus irregularis DAOM 181602=DAOM 197198]